MWGVRPSSCSGPICFFFTGSDNLFKLNCVYSALRLSPRRHKSQRNGRIVWLTIRCSAFRRPCDFRGHRRFTGSPSLQLRKSCVRAHKVTRNDELWWGDGGACRECWVTAVTAHAQGAHGETWNTNTRRTDKNTIEIQIDEIENENKDMQVSG